MESEEYDYLICISIENTEEIIDNSSHRFLHFDKSKEISPFQTQLSTFPSIIEFDWCTYDLKSHIVIEEVNDFVRPTFSSSLTETTQRRTGINASNCVNSVSLYEVIMRVSFLLTIS